MHEFVGGPVERHFSVGYSDMTPKGGRGEMREGGKEYFVSSSNFGFDFVFEANFAGGNMSVCPSRSPFLPFPSTSFLF